MSFTSIFGNGLISPSDLSYRALSITANVALGWPTEVSTNANITADILDVSALSASLVITMPSALLVTPGQTVVVANRGDYIFDVVDAAGGAIVTVPTGAVWFLYVSDNTTAAGVWRSLQYGATTSSAQAATLAGAGLRASGGLLTQSVPVTQKSTNYTLGANDRAQAIVWTGGAGTLTLPAAGTVGADWFVHVKNAGSGIVTISSAASLIDAATSVALDLNDGCVILTDGATYYTLARGQGGAAGSSFDYINIAVGGTGDFTLNASQQGKVSYKFSGTLTGNRNIIVPASVQQYWVDNSTTGSFTLTVKTLTGAGPTIAQGSRAILYCNGVDVLNGSTAGISVPIAITDGGTGATSASAARTALGSTTVGDALFVAASQAAARSAIGAPASTDITDSSLLYSLVMS